MLPTSVCATPGSCIASNHSCPATRQPMGPAMQAGSAGRPQPTSLSQGMQAHRSPLGFSLADKPSRTVYVCAQYGQGSWGAVGRFRLPSAATAGAAAASTRDPPSARRLFSRVTTSNPAYALQGSTDDCIAGQITKQLSQGVQCAKH